ncbi:excinuclease ABC subunit C [Marispirochaeta aestuarii]|uniref:UvrABC system protein C n=1 Tax=Marispirochaeta aestuarii TaxID=1963862 RepID=A0A1Y1RZ87_9SPIO|nr:excinuclease ABC subunit UvrC [Marispirochaeta aestuarii]ORC35962.1 excinuclease ABC subunit C [Marispirochaeta aestuarii]
MKERGDDERLIDLKEQVAEFPHSPGVYIMKDSSSRVIYVGKAVDLRKRAGSYFIGEKDIKTRFLVQRIASIEYIVTANEYEALVLENNLIKQWTPRYNVNLKDGKSYPVIRITADEFPRVFRTRRIVRDGSEYFGPYPDARSVDRYLELIERLFPLRKCKGKLKKRDTPCLYYHIGRCRAPCVGKISREDYAREVDRVRKLLSGATEELISDLKAEMEEAAADLKFEKAASLRDSIAAVVSVEEGQQVQDFQEESRDYLAVATAGRFASFAVMQMRGGKLVGRELYGNVSPQDEEELLFDFLLQYYTPDHRPPEIIYLSHRVNKALLGEFFSSQGWTECSVEVPEEGRHRSIVHMALENASMDVQKRQKASANLPALEELRIVLGLGSLPRRIEGFDIAHLAGKHTVASLVSFYNGNPDKKNYRSFNIRSLKGEIDDFQAMREAMARRYTRVLNEGLPRPDLVVIDGGKGQLNAALEIIRGLGLEEVAVIGLAKKNEEIFLPGRSDPVSLPETAEALKVLQAVRDESHRFATSLSRRQRSSDLHLGRLTGIPGIGERRAAALIQEFGGIDGLSAASYEDLRNRGRLPEAVAERVVAEFSAKKPDSGN